MDIWFERFTVPKLIFLVIDKNNASKTTVYYPDISYLASVLLNWFKAKGLFKWINFQELTLGVQMQSGETLRYRAEELTDTVIEKIFNRFLSGEEYIPQHLRGYTSRIHLAFKSYLINYFFKQKIYFLCAIDHLYQTNPCFKDEKPRYWLDYIPLFMEFNKAISPCIRGALHVWPDIINIIKEHFPVRVSVQVLKFIISSCIHQRKSREKFIDLFQDGRSKILVEFCRNTFLDMERTHLFWFSNDCISPSRVIMYFDRKDSPASKENVRLVERYNMRWLNLQKNALYFHISNSIKLLIRNFSRVPFFQQWREPVIWRWKTMFEFSYYLEIWREIIRKYNIKVFHQHQEHDFWSHIQSLSIDIEGGIYFWFHWSHEYIPCSYRNAAYCDIFFSWGKFSHDYIDLHNFKYRYIVYVGCIWDGAYRPDEGIVSLGRNGMNKNADFILTLFDTSRDLWVHCSPYMASYFYESVLQMILEHPTWAVIIKPKKHDTFSTMPNREKIKKMIETLTSEKRCALLSARCVPFTAVRAADACVCQEINSAGSIAALSGCKTIYWDLAGNTRHPYYLDAKGRFVFKTKKEIGLALESMARSKGSQHGIGDHSSWLNMIDPYRDGKAGFRTGQFIRSFLTYVDKGYARDTALERTVEEFAARWGNDKVYTFETKSERTNDNIWIKAKEILQK